MTPETRALLAEYNVLAAYDRRRFVLYGDMASTRRRRELNRIGDALVAAGAPVDADGRLPASTHAELVLAWDRVARPRIRRVEREQYRHATKYTQATIAAWRDVARALNIPT